MRTHLLQHHLRHPHCTVIYNTRHANHCRLLYAKYVDIPTQYMLYLLMCACVHLHRPARWDLQLSWPAEIAFCNCMHVHAYSKAGGGRVQGCLRLARVHVCLSAYRCAPWEIPLASAVPLEETESNRCYFIFCKGVTTRSKHSTSHHLALYESCLHTAHACKISRHITA